MKSTLAASLAILLAASTAMGSPARAEPDRKTDLVTLNGTSVDLMRLRHDFDGVWVIDNQNILYRDDVPDYYLVTLDNACPTLDIRSREFSFHPAWSWQLRANFSYEVRPNAGSPCDVSRIAQIDDDKAVALRDAAQWRVWR